MLALLPVANLLPLKQVVAEILAERA